MLYWVIFIKDCVVNLRAKSNYYYLILFVFVFGICALTRYKGNSHPFYTDIYQYILDQSLYENDIYLKNSFFRSSSLFYDLVSVVKISPDNDLVYFPIYLGFCLLAVYSVWRIVVEYCHFENFSLSLLALMPVLVFDAFILDSTRGSILINHTGGPTVYAHALMYPLILATLKRMWWLCALISTVMVMLTVKVAWFPISVSLICCILLEKKRMYKVVWAFFPLAAVMLLSNGVEIPNEHSERLKLVELVLARNYQEDAFNLQSMEKLIAFVCSFFVFFFISNRIKNHYLKTYMQTLGISAGLVATLGLLYTSLLYKFYPDPRIILLSPVRAMSLYQFMFILLLSQFILRKNMHWLGSSLFIASLFIIGTSQDIRASLVGIGVFMVGLIITYSERKRGITSTKIDAARFVTAMLLIVPAQGYLLYKSINRDFDIFTLHKIDRWTNVTVSEPNIVRASYSLRQCPDFILLTLIEDQKKAYFTNTIAQKSKFIGDYAHFYFDSVLYEEHLRREKLLNKLLISVYNLSDVKYAAVNIFTHYPVAILGDKSLLPMFPKNLSHVEFDGGVVLMFSKTNYALRNALIKCGMRVINDGML